MSTRAMRRRLAALRQRNQTQEPNGAVLVGASENQIRAILDQGRIAICLPDNHRGNKPCEQHETA
ncbi:hypothetical protein [Thiocapsa sp.]|uniref:hypothetical protein n=1 Tax=Thiocapsa sp. TaxID=2024551 RepID=UPI002B58602B|nr:hypothetical protein [Thiocapsa sp.]HSO84286.1 hypothetical protein [Thiocapsa sp.]